MATAVSDRRAATVAWLDEYRESPNPATAMLRAPARQRPPRREKQPAHRTSHGCAPALASCPEWQWQPRQVAGEVVHSHRLRVTRRGRAVATAVVLAALSTAAVLARPATPPAVRSPSHSTVVVRPGDSLWTVAVRADPNRDPRLTVERIIAANHLSQAVVRPGQQLRLR